MNRRLLMHTTAIFAAFSVLGSYTAFAATGVDALDTPAIPVKFPSGVLLIAITRIASNRLVAVGEHGVIIWSDDEGGSWTQALVPANVTLTCVAFATSQIGWAAGHFGAILKTEDGGESWKMQLNGIETIQLMLAAAQDFATATSPSPAAPLAAKRAQHFADDGPDKPFLTLLVFGPQKIIAFGAYRMAVVSTDGGAHWTDLSLNIYDRLSHNLYGATLVGGNAYVVGEEGLVFQSTDGGATFLPLTPAVQSTLFGILGSSDGALIVYGVAGACMRSTDAGKTWNPVALASQDDLTAARLLPSGNILVATESGGVFKSTDGGASFNLIPGIRPEPIFDLQNTKDGGLVIVGAMGVEQVSSGVLNS